MAQEFWHIVNGKRFTRIGLENLPVTLEEYKRFLCQAYGSLKGVKYGEIPQGKPHPTF